jgi:PAS domain S-box-containing protein
METDGTLIEANRSALQFAGIREEDVLGKLFWDTPWWTHSPDLQNRLREAVRQASGGAMVRFEATHPSSTGQLAYVDFSLKPVRDEHGNVTLLIPEGRDITERKQVEAALRESEERYHSIFENAVEGIFQTTADGKYIAVNPALARIYGYDSPDDMIATITDIASQLYVDPGRRDEFLCLMQAQEEVTGFEALVYRKDGSFIWISESARTLRDQAGTVVAYEGTVEDITERKRAEGRLRATLDHVRTLSGRLAAMQEEERTHIARELHDELGVRLTCLKIDLSRLMSIVGNRVRADVRVKLNDRVRSMVGQVDSTIASLQQLVTQLRPALLDDLGLVAAIEWQSQDFQKRTGISCICETSTDDIAMEPERATAVFRICQEALTNTARHAQATAVTVTVTSQPDSLKLVVADNGVGVPNTKALDPRSLGLIGMQERAAQCGGTLTIEGDPQKGTTVTLYLPVGGGDSLNHRGIHAESSGGR